MAKSPEAFRTISEVAAELGVQQHVLRFWETKFTEIKPMKRGGGRRYYRPEDVDLLKRIQQLLYEEKYTIKGVQQLFKEQASGRQDKPQPVSHADLPAVQRRALEDIRAGLVQLRDDLRALAAGD